MATTAEDMRGKCVHCGKRRGSRYCPALGGPICSRCCGENRLVRITCPSSCPQLERHEAFQRDRQGVRYREAWAKVNADLRDRDQDLHLLLSLERLLKETTEHLEGLTDADVAGAIAELIPRMSPIELITQGPSPLGRLLWEELEPVLEEGKLSRERVKDGLTRMAKVVDALRDPEAPRAFIQGLSAHLQGLFPEEKSQERTGLILTPDDLRRSP